MKWRGWPNVSLVTLQRGFWMRRDEGAGTPVGAFNINNLEFAKGRGMSACRLRKDPQS